MSLSAMSLREDLRVQRKEMLLLYHRRQLLGAWRAIPPLIASKYIDGKVWGLLFYNLANPTETRIPTLEELLDIGTFAEKTAIATEQAEDGERERNK